MASMREICRLCMCRDDSMLSIFGEDSLAAKITWVSQLKVFEGDPLPAQICKQCSLRLTAAYYFKEQCVAIDRTLREMVLHQCSASMPQDRRDVSTSSTQVSSTERIDYRHEHSQSEVLSKVENSRTPFAYCSQENSINDYACNGSAQEFEVKCDGTNLMSNSAHNSLEHFSQQMPQSSPVPNSGLSICPICNKKFQSRANLKRHIVVHSKLQNRNQQTNVGRSRKNISIRRDSSVIPAISNSTGSQEITIKYEPVVFSTDKALPLSTVGTPDSKTDNSPLNRCPVNVSGGFAHSSGIKVSSSVETNSSTQSDASDIEHSMVSFPSSVISGLTFGVDRDAETKNGNSFNSASKKTQQTRRSRSKGTKSCYECPFCDKKYYTKHEAELHVLSHLQSETDDGPPLQLDEFEPIILKPIPSNTRLYKCNVCGKSFTKKYHLSYHEHAHTKEKLHPCHICSKTFRDEYSVFAHHSKAHGLKNPFTCPLCDASFIRGTLLKQHLRNVHNAQSFCCVICKQSFSEVHFYREHLKTHANKTQDV